MTSFINTSGTQDDEALESVQAPLNGELKQPVALEKQQMTRRGMLMTAGAAFALLATGGTKADAGEPNGTKYASITETVESPYLTEELDADYHVKRLKSHPKYNDFLQQPGMLKYLQELRKKETAKSFIASVIVLFGEFVKNNTSTEDLENDKEFKDYYLGTVFSEDITLQLNSKFRYNGLYLPQHKNLVILAYGIHEESQELIDAEIVAINPERGESTSSVGNMPRRKHFQNKLAEIERTVVIK